MYVVAEHMITNPDAFFALAGKVGEAPSGLNTIHFFPSTSQNRAVCLWEANSVDAVRSFLEPMASECSINTYYAVDGTKAMGLPIKKAAA